MGTVAGFARKHAFYPVAEEAVDVLTGGLRCVAGLAVRLLGDPAFILEVGTIKEVAGKTMLQPDILDDFDWCHIRVALMAKPSCFLYPKGIPGFVTFCTGYPVLSMGNVE